MKAVKRSGKRLFAAILVIVMMMSLMPAGAFAAADYTVTVKSGETPLEGAAMQFYAGETPLGSSAVTDKGTGMAMFDSSAIADATSVKVTLKGYPHMDR